MPRQPEHQGKRVLGNRYGICARRVHYCNAVAGGGVQVNVIHANSGAPDHAQLGGVLKQLGVHVHRRTHYQRIRIRQLLG